MSSATLDAVIASQEALIRALDGRPTDGEADGPAGIEAAIEQLRTALDAARAAGGWRQSPEIVERVRHALALAESARARLHYLADRTRRQLDQLAALGVRTPGSLAYGRDGRIQA